MKKIMMLLIPIFMGSCLMATAEPYAEKVKITSGTTPMGQMVIKDSKVPDRSTVSMPPYPGAVIFQTRDSGSAEINGKAVNTLPYIKLLTSDDMDKVVAWYKDNLSTYYYQKQGFAGMFTHIFWKEEGDYNMFDIYARMVNENVGISDGEIHKDDYSKAKTMIEITYIAK